MSWPVTIWLIPSTAAIAEKAQLLSEKEELISDLHIYVCAKILAYVYYILIQVVGRNRASRATHLLELIDWELWLVMTMQIVADKKREPAATD
jgi:hypothetical protein